MTNENQKKSPLKKYKFLIPIIVFVIIASMVLINLGEINKGSITLVLVILIPFLTSSFLYYKFEFDASWKEKRSKRIKEEKNLAKKDRYGVAAEVDSLVILLIFGICLTIYSIIKNLIEHKYYNALVLTTFALLVFLIIKAVNKFFSKK